MKKKSTIFALIAVICVAAALYFMYKETRATYDISIEEEPEEEEPEEEEAEPIKKVNDDIKEEAAGTGTEAGTV
jgi:hypothetical protein